jgi:uncharacterized protein YuzE
VEPVNIAIGPVVFDHADYDADSDVLYLHVGEPQEAEGEETPEGHLLRYAPGSQRIVGLTIVNAKWLLDRDGRLTVTIPEQIHTSADSLAPALVAS